MRKSWVLMLALVVLLSLTVGSAFAFKMPKIPGKSSLKKEIKAFTLKDLDASLADLEGTDLDPGKDKKFATAVYGDKDFDNLAVGLLKMEMAVELANNVIKDTNAKLAEAKSADDLAPLEKNIDLVTKVVEKLVTEGAKLVPVATKFGKELPNKIKEDPLGYGANGKDMTKVVTKLPKTVDQLPDTVKALADTLKKVVEKKEMLKSGEGEAAAE